jgi:hypothetical protein
MQHSPPDKTVSKKNDSANLKTTIISSLIFSGACADTSRVRRRIKRNC